MSELKSHSDLENAFRELMAGYRAALNASDRLDLLNKAFIHNVVSVSSNEAYNRLVLRAENIQTLSAEIKEFASEVAKKDRIAGILSFSQAQAKEQGKKAIEFLIFGAGIGAIVNAVLSFLGNILISSVQYGSSVPPSVSFQIIRLLLAGGFGATILKNYWNSVVETWNSALPAQTVLSSILDKPESHFFGLVGGGKPKRPIVSLVGPIMAIGLVVIGIVVGFMVLGVFFGMLTAIF